MYNSQLIKICKSLSKSELRELERFVHSPYFNQKEEVTRLYDYIAQNLGSNPILFQKEKIYEILFPRQQYNDGHMRLMIHNLLKIIKLYFIQKEMESDETDIQLHLARAMKKRGFDGGFEKEITIVEESNIKKPYRNANFFYKNYLIEIEQLEHLTFSRRKGEMPYQNLFDSLVKFYIIEILRHRSVALSYQTVAHGHYEVPLFESVIELLEKGNFLKKNANNTEGVAIALYYNIYKALKTNDDIYFKELKKLLSKNWMCFPESESRVIYLQAINFCIKRINIGEKNYLDEYFDLTQSGLENKLLFENGVLSKFTFKNAVTVALRLEKFDWVKQFLDNYKQYLHPKDKETAYNFNSATYYYRLKNYSEAMKLLQKIDTNDVLTNTDARSMLIRIYYDTQAFDALSSLLDSFLTYINRQKDISYHKQSYLNFILFIKQLLKIDMKNQTEKDKLLKEINATKNVVEKDWLIEKLQ